MNTTRLSYQQIRTEFFEVPLVLVRLLVSAELANYVGEHDAASRLTGGETQLFAWPDGTTVVLTRDDASQPLDVEILAELYQNARELSEYQHGYGRLRAH